MPLLVQLPEAEVHVRTLQLTGVSSTQQDWLLPARTGTPPGPLPLQLLH
jgi:hypothetical protein